MKPTAWPRVMAFPAPLRRPTRFLNSPASASGNVKDSLALPPPASRSRTVPSSAITNGEDSTARHLSSRQRSQSASRQKPFVGPGRSIPPPLLCPIPPRPCPARTPSCASSPCSRLGCTSRSRWLPPLGCMAIPPAPPPSPDPAAIPSDRSPPDFHPAFSRFSRRPLPSSSAIPPAPRSPAGAAAPCFRRLASFPLPTSGFPSGRCCNSSSANPPSSLPSEADRAASAPIRPGSSPSRPSPRNPSSPARSLSAWPTAAMPSTKPPLADRFRQNSASQVLSSEPHSLPRQ